MSVIQVQEEFSESMTDRPSTYVRSLFPGKKRIRSMMSSPDDDLIDAYDNDIARAIRSGDVIQLREYLDEGRRFDGCNRNGESLLHLACRRGDFEIVEFLLHDACVPTNVHDNLGRTVLHDVCWRPTPDFDLMDLMIRAVTPALLIQEDARGHSAFDYCRKEHHGEWLDFLKKFTPIIQRRSKLYGML
jgi:hypothetical protein